MDTKTFEKFAALIYERTGICLGPKKEALVAARVGKRLRALGLDRYDAYYEHVRNDPTGVEMVELINAISTNVTEFFREPRHFALLGKVLRDWAAEGQTRFRLWSAACSTGQEPYSMAITAAETLNGSADARILATDISTRALERAKAGVYPATDLQKAPDSARRHFVRVRPENAGSNNEGMLKVCDRLRAMVSFARLNLSETPFPMKGPFDVIFCRNVMIYFDSEVRGRLLAECRRLLKSGGYLLVGHAESLAGMMSGLRAVAPAVYRKD